MIGRQEKISENLAEQQTIGRQLLKQENEGEKGDKITSGCRNSWVAGPTPIRIKKMSSTNDPEAYLHTFEQVATTAGWPKEQWTLILVPCLTRVLQEVIDTLSIVEAAQYETLKRVILQTSNLTEEAYRKRFRELRLKPGVHPQILTQKIKANLVCWLRPEEKAKEELLEMLVMEQLITTLGNNLCNWVQRNQPKRLEDAVRLVEDFCMAEEEGREISHPTPERF